MPIRNLSFYDFQVNFSTEEKCLAFYAYLRWGKTPTCPYCNSKRSYTYKSRPVFRCKSCDSQYSAKTGTLFANSQIPLTKWFLVYYLLSTYKKGMSSVQISKYVKLSQKTTWRMMQKIRTTLGDDMDFLSGVIEVDECYIGPKPRRYDRRRYKRGRGSENKTPVFGMLQRDGKLRIMPVKDVTAKTLQRLIYDYVEDGSTIMSDEWKAYWGLDKLYIHKTVFHADKQYVNGDAHVNGLEGAWSHLRRMVAGTYQRPSKKYLHLYCNEFEFRYNNRNKSLYIQFTNAMKLASKKVVGKPFS